MKTEETRELPSRVLLLVIVGLVALGPISTDLYLPALPSIAAAFAVGAGETQLTLSVFLAGFAATMLVYGPLSDRFGRRPVLLAAILLYCLGTVLCASAESIGSLIAARFLQALGASAGPVVARAVVRDLYAPESAGRILSYVAMAMGLAPALGPILGGLITVAFGWRANFLLLLAFGLASLLAVLRLLPETNRLPDAGALRPLTLIANYRSLLAHRRYLGYVLVVTAGYSCIFSYISGSSFVLIEGLGLAPDEYSWCFAAAVLGYMGGSLTGARASGRFSLDGLLRAGALVAVAGGLAGAALALAGVFSVATVVAPAAVVFFGCGLTQPHGMAGAIGPFPRMAGAASALLGFLQMSGAAVVGILVGQLEDGTPRAMALAMALSALAALAAHLWLSASPRNGEVSAR